MNHILVPFERRFQYKVYPRGDCWEYRGYHYPNGYGMVNVTIGQTQTKRLAHRVAYEMAKGPIPLGQEIDHLCRHRWCVRPSHLEAVSPRENMLRGDSFAARFARATTCKNGHPLQPDPRYEGKYRWCPVCCRNRWSSRNKKVA